MVEEAPTQTPEATREATAEPTQTPDPTPAISATPSPSPTAEPTPRPESALKLSGSYEMLDDWDRSIGTLKEGEYANIVFHLVDRGLTRAHLPGGEADISVSLHGGSFTLVENRRENANHTGYPVVRMVSDSPLAFTVTFPHMRYSGEKREIDFTVAYRGEIQGSLRVREPEMVECVITQETPTATPAPEATETPMPEDTQTPAPEDTETPAPEVTQTPAPEDTQTPAPEDTQTPAPEDTQTPAPEDTGTPAPENTQTPAPAVSDSPAPSVKPTARPKPSPTPEAEHPQASQEPVPAPVVHITRGEMAPIQAGEPFTVEVIFTNYGKEAVEIPVATFTASEGIALDERSPSFILERMAPGEAYSMRLHMKAGKELAASQYAVEVALKFEYQTEGQAAQGSASDKLLIPAVIPEKREVSAGVVIGRTDFLRPVTAGQDVVLTLWFKNTGNVSLLRPVASFSPSEALTLMEATTSALLPDIPPGETAAMQLRLKANKEIPAPQQHVQVELKYDYRQENGQIQQGSASEKVLVPAVVKQRSSGGGGGGGSKKPEPEKPVPNIIISRYDFGAGQVAAGAEFPLNITFKNTNELRGVENIVMTLETSEALTITSSSNTAFFQSLAPGAEQSVQLRMMALPAAKTEPARVDVGFKYEYLDPEKRSSTTVSEKIFVPIYQPDRMTLSAPTGPENAEVGKEVVISIPYVNKGKSEVANLSATLEGKVKALAKVINAGNIESGKSGSLDFILTPDKEGVEQFSIQVSYEDASTKPIVQAFPLSISVAQAYEDLPPEGEEGEMNLPEPPETTGGDNNRLITYGLGGLWAATVAGGLISRRRRKRKLREQEAMFKFEDDFPGGKA